MGVREGRYTRGVKRVLVVDDDPGVLGLVAEMLRGDGYEVETAQNGVEALAKLREHEPDVVVTDLVMPVMDGLALIKACRATRHLADVPIVVLSAYYPLL